MSFKSELREEREASWTDSDIKSLTIKTLEDRLDERSRQCNTTMTVVIKLAQMLYAIKAGRISVDEAISNFESFTSKELVYFCKDAVNPNLDEKIAELNKSQDDWLNIKNDYAEDDTDTIVLINKQN